jgi:hypothetical protein
MSLKEREGMQLRRIYCSIKMTLLAPGRVPNVPNTNATTWKLVVEKKGQSLRLVPRPLALPTVYQPNHPRQIHNAMDLAGRRRNFYWSTESLSGGSRGQGRVLFPILDWDVRTARGGIGAFSHLYRLPYVLAERGGLCDVG